MFDDGGASLNALIGRINITPMANAQQYAQMNPEARSASDYARTATTGQRDPQQARARNAPMSTPGVTMPSFNPGRNTPRR